MVLIAVPGALYFARSNRDNTAFQRRPLRRLPAGREGELRVVYKATRIIPQLKEPPS